MTCLTQKVYIFANIDIIFDQKLAGFHLFHILTVEN